MCSLGPTGVQSRSVHNKIRFFFFADGISDLMCEKYSIDMLDAPSLYSIFITGINLCHIILGSINNFICLVELDRAKQP